MSVRGTSGKQPNPQAGKVEGGKPASRTAQARAAAKASAPANRFEHTATVGLDAKLTPAAQGGKRVADAVMRCIGSYDRTFLLDTDGLKAHVQQVATRFVDVAEHARDEGSVYAQLKGQYPGAQISLVGTASTQEADQVYYLVRTADGAVHSFEGVGGKPVEDPSANGQIFMAVDLDAPGRHMAVRVPDVRFLISPTLPPSYGVGRNIDVVMDTPLDGQKRNAADQLESQGIPGVSKEILPGDKKGEDGSALGVILQEQREEKGRIVKYNGDKTYDVEVTQPDGTKRVVTESEDQIRAANDPMVYDLNGATFDDVRIDVGNDPKLADFLAQAKAVAAKDIPTGGTPEQVAAGQKQALVDLTLLCNKALSYPDEAKDTTDEGSKKFMALADAHSNWDPMKLGDLLDCGRGVCRHQAILMQLCCQEAGIASRTVSASANDRQGNFRGYHAFLETTLDDGTQYLTDPTWFDAGPSNVKGYNFSPVLPNGQKEEGTPLWDTLYYQACRQVLPSWQDNHGNEDHGAVGFREGNDPVVDDQGHVVPPAVTPTPPPTPTPLDDAPAFLSKVENALVGEDFSAYGDSYAQVSAADSLKDGDWEVQNSTARDAAFFYALGLRKSPEPALAKQLWTKLAEQLDKNGQADLAAAARTHASAINA